MDTPKEKPGSKISPPKFGIATALALFVPLLCYISVWCSGVPERVLVLFLIIAMSILLLLEVKQYFRYLNQVALVRPVTQMVISDLIIGGTVLVLVGFFVNRYQAPVVFILLSIMLFLALSLNVYAGIILGGKLQDMGNRNGNMFLLALGVAYRYIIPAVLVLTLIVHYSNYIDPVYFSAKYLCWRMTAATLINVPNILFAAMFFIAGKKIKIQQPLASDIPIS